MVHSFCFLGLSRIGSVLATEVSMLIHVPYHLPFQLSFFHSDYAVREVDRTEEVQAAPRWLLLAVVVVERYWPLTLSSFLNDSLLAEVVPARLRY